jgi:hypothetical protein
MHAPQGRPPLHLCHQFTQQVLCSSVCGETRTSPPPSGPPRRPPPLRPRAPPKAHASPCARASACAPHCSRAEALDWWHIRASSMAEPGMRQMLGMRGPAEGVCTHLVSSSASGSDEAGRFFLRSCFSLRAGLPSRAEALHQRFTRCSRMAEPQAGHDGPGSMCRCCRHTLCFTWSVKPCVTSRRPASRQWAGAGGGPQAYLSRIGATSVSAGGLLGRFWRAPSSDAEDISSPLHPPLESSGAHCAGNLDNNDPPSAVSLQAPVRCCSATDLPHDKTLALFVGLPRSRGKNF